MNRILASRKVVWPAVIILAAIYFSSTLIRGFHPPATPGMAPANPAAVKPSAAIPPPALPPPPSEQQGATASLEPRNDPSFPKFLGLWQGGVALPKRGTCQLHLDVQDNHEKVHPFTAYSTLSCMPSVLEMLSSANARKMNPAGAADNMVKAMAPISSILSGTLQNGVVTLEAKKSFGLGQVDSGCPLSSLTLTPFSDNMAAEWKENGQDLCQGGQIMMQRAAR
jgi:hypothetical protein